MMRRGAVVATLLTLAATFWHLPMPASSADRSREPIPGTPALSGTVSCRERVALPSMATLRVELVDASAREARSALVGEESYWITRGKFPMDFRIAYDPARIDPGHVYIVRARVMDGDKVLLTSTVPYPVLTRGAPRTIDIVVVPARPSSP
jgi:putative lipoprotein